MHRPWCLVIFMFFDCLLSKRVISRKTLLVSLGVPSFPKLLSLLDWPTYLSSIKRDCLWLFADKSLCLALRVLSSLRVSPNRVPTDSLVATGNSGCFLTLLGEVSLIFGNEFCFGGEFSSLFFVSKWETAVLVSKTSSSECCDFSLSSVTLFIQNIN